MIREEYQIMTNDIKKAMDLWEKLFSGDAWEPGTTALDLIYYMCRPISLEKTWAGGKLNYASKSEIKRLFAKKCITINNRHPQPFDVVEFPIETIILFPDNPKRRVIFGS